MCGTQWHSQIFMADWAMTGRILLRSSYTTEGLYNVCVTCIGQPVSTLILYSIIAEVLVD